MNYDTEIEEVVWTSGYYDIMDEDGTITIKNLQKFLDEKLKNVPDEYKDSVMFGFSTDCYYDSPSSFTKIYYMRPKTEEELNQDRKREDKILEVIKQRDLKELEIIKNKYNL